MSFYRIDITAGPAAGKTLAAIATAKILMKENWYKSILIAAPEGLPEFFEKELRTGLDEGVKVTIVESLDQIPEFTPKYDIVVDDLSGLTDRSLTQLVAENGRLIRTHSRLI